MEQNLKMENDILQILLICNDNQKAAKEIVDYIIKYQNRLDHIDITDRLEPYANDKVKSFWKNMIDPSKTNEFGSVCYMGMVVELSLSNHLGRTDLVTEEEYKIFAEYLNKAADLDLIGGGVVNFTAIRMSLAVVSPSRRTMLISCSFSKKSIKELKEISNLFASEGELPVMMENIKFNV